MSGDRSIANVHFVGSTGLSHITILRPPVVPIPYDDALTFAAWIVAIADQSEDHSRFAEILSLVEGGEPPRPPEAHEHRLIRPDGNLLWTATSNPGTVWDLSEMIARIAGPFRYEWRPVGSETWIVNYERGASQ